MENSEGKRPVGRPKAFDSPEQLAELFQEYIAETKAKPILKQDFVGRDAQEVERKIQRPLTIDGFENFLYYRGIISDLGGYFANSGGRYSEFSTICHTIKKIVRQDQIEGGMAGIYNPSITQRLNNLVEKTQSDVSINKPVFIDLTGNDTTDEETSGSI